jgi:hypothetical protein
VVVALICLVFTIFLLVAPIQKSSSNGAQFDCGSALNPPSASFPKAVCGKLPQTRRLQAGALATTGLLIAVGGVWVFGFNDRAPRRGMSSGEKPR